MDHPEIPVYSFSQVPMELKMKSRPNCAKNWRHKRAKVIAESQVPDLEEQLSATQTPVLVRTLKITDSGEAKESSSEVASAIGLIGGMIIYFFIFMYASQVMKGVIEEKQTGLSRYWSLLSNRFNFC